MKTYLDILDRYGWAYSHSTNINMLTGKAVNGTYTDPCKTGWVVGILVRSNSDKIYPNHQDFTVSAHKLGSGHRITFRSPDQFLRYIKRKTKSLNRV